jgi:ribosomal protein L3
MPGQLGNEQVTVRNLLIIRILLERQVILVKGAVGREEVEEVKRIE